VNACDQLAKEGLYPAHYDLRFVKPLDADLLHEVFNNFTKIITVEDHSIQGGFGSSIAEFMIDNGYMAQITRLGVPDIFIEHGEQKELYNECSFDAAAIMSAVRQIIGSVIEVSH
jgi:1-deoxy-D-xylulose-5-phosphate synthase